MGHRVDCIQSTEIYFVKVNEKEIILYLNEIINNFFILTNVSR